MKKRSEPRSANQSTSLIEVSRRGLRRWLLWPPAHPLREVAEQFQQHGVAFTVEFVDRAVGCLFLHAVDDRLLNLGLNSVIVPRSFHHEATGPERCSMKW